MITILYNYVSDSDSTIPEIRQDFRREKQNPCYRLTLASISQFLSPLVI
jgi:hypothetical protein